MGTWCLRLYALRPWHYGQPPRLRQVRSINSAPWYGRLCSLPCSLPCSIALSRLIRPLSSSCYGRMYIGSLGCHPDYCASHHRHGALPRPALYAQLVGSHGTTGIGLDAPPSSFAMSCRPRMPAALCLLTLCYIFCLHCVALCAAHNIHPGPSRIDRSQDADRFA